MLLQLIELFFSPGTNLLNHLTNIRNCLILFHPFGGDDSIHQYIKQVDTINIPDVEYQQGAGSVQKSLPKDDKYLTTNFDNESVISFPPNIIPDHVGNDDYVGLLLNCYHNNFEAAHMVGKHAIVHINKQKNPLLIDRFGFHFEGEDMVITFDGTLNIITLTVFSASTTEVDVHKDLKQLESAMKSFISISADLLTDDISLGNHLVIVGVVCFTSQDNVFENKWLPSCSETFCVNNFLTFHQLSSQEKFDLWYQKVLIYLLYLSS